MEVYCHPASLVKQLASYERWALIIELFLGVNAAVVCAMLAYMMCQGSAGSLGSLCSLVGLFPFKRAPFILICYTFLFEKIFLFFFLLRFFYEVHWDFIWLFCKNLIYFVLYRKKLKDSFTLIQILKGLFWIS